MDCGCVLSGVYIVLYHKRSVVGPVNVHVCRCRLIMGNGSLLCVTIQYL